ncbi:DUF2550 domain-containing protein [Kineosporia sp. NBRC 101731]|uniref:DUF2550 domain-containing protein n=1 Tax=Kineosporia sp. NBRC 101731 TaxID=3032199 RepID=UPI0024A483DD|nr:DUF2550 domain-containing protein [Kineosporia sp. NBRC 101731]GLY28015.1 hypothetical protein Kisp02_13800 [Kineosporia sp. NBRC 101731]
MGDLVAPLEILGALLVLFGLVLALFILRRYLLARNGATFDCSVRHEYPRRASAWILGVARYGEDTLEWFRIFTVDPRPSRVFVRSQLFLVEWEQPAEQEINSILPGAVIVRCTYGDEKLDMAMTRSDYTGFITWLEATPPGIAPFSA